MATTTQFYTNFLLGLGKGRFNFDTDTLNVLLTTASYTPNLATHVSLSDVTNEVTGAGYTAGGQSLSSVVWSAPDDTTGALTAENVTWSSLTLTARQGVLYQNTGTPSTSRLIACYDFGEDKVRTAEPLTLYFASSNVVMLQVSV